MQKLLHDTAHPPEASGRVYFPKETLNKSFYRQHLDAIEANQVERLTPETTQTLKWCSEITERYEVARKEALEAAATVEFGAEMPEDIIRRYKLATTFKTVSDVIGLSIVDSHANVLNFGYDTLGDQGWGISGVMNSYRPKGLQGTDSHGMFNATVDSEGNLKKAALAISLDQDQFRPLGPYNNSPLPTVLTMEYSRKEESAEVPHWRLVLKRPYREKVDGPLSYKESVLSESVDPLVVGPALFKALKDGTTTELTREYQQNAKKSQASKSDSVITIL